MQRGSLCGDYVTVIPVAGTSFTEYILFIDNLLIQTIETKLNCTMREVSVVRRNRRYLSPNM